uniref:WIF domain-containing protein n=1 Tax=Hucho hucho TaxID=62062 RepID=A0A4W5KM08_9TELE
MAPFTTDFRKAQQRMPAIPVNIQTVNFTWQATEQAEFFYEFQTLRSMDLDIMDNPTVNVPLLGSVPCRPSGETGAGKSMLLSECWCLLNT